MNKYYKYIMIIFSLSQKTNEKHDFLCDRQAIDVEI